MSVIIPQQARDLIGDKNYAHLCSIGRDGWPHSTPVWIDWSGDSLIAASDASTAKIRNIESNPKVVISILDRNNPHSWVQVLGSASIDIDEDARTLNHLSNKYFGKNYPFDVDESQRRTIRIDIERILTFIPQK